MASLASAIAKVSDQMRHWGAVRREYTPSPPRPHLSVRKLKVIPALYGSGVEPAERGAWPCSIDKTNVALRYAPPGCCTIHIHPVLFPQCAKKSGCRSSRNAARFRTHNRRTFSIQTKVTWVTGSCSERRPVKPSIQKPPSKHAAVGPTPLFQFGKWDEYGACGRSGDYIFRAPALYSVFSMLN